MAVSDYLFVCLIGALPGPPGVRIEDAYVQLFPINKHKCPEIDPVRDIRFELFTVYNPLMAQNLIIGDDKLLQASYFNFSHPTVVFFHAFFESSQATSATLIKTAYLQRGGYNIILPNAPRLEAGPWYYTASRNTMVVGQYTAKLIDYLVTCGLHLPSLHLVGLSLGAQMAGVCGQSVQSGRIFRITGLDPAGPLFKKWPKSLKLDASDAEFVDIIHTDAGIFGYPTQIGHVDFWPNGGISPQPGCTIAEVKKRSPGSIIEPLFCSHWRSYQFYAESVLNTKGFVSVPCQSWNHYTKNDCRADLPISNMGFNVDLNAKGNYYLKTTGQSPFSGEAYGYVPQHSQEENSEVQRYDNDIQNDEQNANDFTQAFDHQAYKEPNNQQLVYNPDEQNQQYQLQFQYHVDQVYSQPHYQQDQPNQHNVGYEAPFGRGQFVPHTQTPLVERKHI